MANTKETMLDALVVQLGAITGVTLATRDLRTPLQQRESEPYIGVIAGSEENIAEDATDVLWELQVDLVMGVMGEDIEDLVDEVREVVFDTSTPTTIGAKHIRLESTEEVAVIKEDNYSSTRMILIITYSSEKGAF